MPATKNAIPWEEPRVAAEFRRLCGGGAADVDDLVARFSAFLGRKVTRATCDAQMRREGLTAADVIRAHGAGGGSEAALRRQVKELQAKVRELTDASLSDDSVRRVLGLRDTPFDVPEWLVETQASRKGPGVPMLFGTDWHWGEVVNPSAINGVNEYNLEIANRRARELITRTVDLLKRHMVRPEYPGIVFPLGGDMFSGNIHEELRETNEAQVYACLLDLLGVLCWAIKTLADEFGQVFVPCVIGNHSRDSERVRYKRDVRGSLDWLLYSLLERHFKTVDDQRVTFLVAPSTDALFQVHATRFLLTHGNQFRGGDGLIGPIGPLFRGDAKKRARNMQIDQGYDTMLCGHFHTDIRLRRFIIGSSLVGYNEFADRNNFPVEPPMQPLWIVHPEHGVTISMPVLVERAKNRRAATSWVSWQTAA